MRCLKTKSIQLDDMTVQVRFKKIKNIYLRVLPPDGLVRISVPQRMSLEAVRSFGVSKLGWIKRHQEIIVARKSLDPCACPDRESRFVWGKCYKLEIVELDQAPSVKLDQTRMVLSVRPGAGIDKKREVLERWYRCELNKAVPPLIAKWEPIMGVVVERFFVRCMKTRWGSCNTRRHSIRLNTNLATMSPEVLEFIVVHEMVHLLEPTHNQRFYALMDRFLPQWRNCREQLPHMPHAPEVWQQ